LLQPRRDTVAQVLADILDKKVDPAAIEANLIED
jgi:hypothetical protein